MERETTNRILKFLNAQPKTWAMKLHGGPYQRAGMPDILCVLRSWAIFIEVKQPGKKPTKLQANMLKTLEAKADALVTCVDSFDAFTDWWDSQIGPVYA